MKEGKSPANQQAVKEPSQSKQEQLFYK